MKKVIPTLVFLLAVVTAYANPVDKAAAAKVAGNLLQKQVVDATPDSFTECYLFVGTDGTGFALIAADDCVPLLLGYSLSTGRCLTTSTPGSKPISMTLMLLLRPASRL